MKKKVLITGGAGFIGANFARRFLDLGHDITIIEKEGADLWRLEDIKNELQIHYLDLENYQPLEDFIVFAAGGHLGEHSELFI